MYSVNEKVKVISGNPVQIGTIKAISTWGDVLKGSFSDSTVYYYVWVDKWGIGGSARWMGGTSIEKLNPEEAGNHE